jgi:hypothetical protein
MWLIRISRLWTPATTFSAPCVPGILTLPFSGFPAFSKDPRLRGLAYRSYLP